jgi:hypothetical protein
VDPSHEPPSKEALVRKIPALLLALGLAVGGLTACDTGDEVEIDADDAADDAGDAVEDATD